MQYKISTSIEVRYLSVNRTTGITDLKLTPTNPSGVDQSQIAFTEIGGGLYKASFTPNALGWWWVRVSSLTYPENVFAKSYYVGTTDDPFPTQEDGKITSVDTKFGEVQTTPTTNTLLGRLKDIWDRLATILSVRLSDGTHFIQSILDSSGNYNIGASILQNVISSTKNSSTTNLNAEATFTGLSESTLGVAGIQVTIKTDQNCTVYVDQSPDGTNWDIIDTFNYKYSLGGSGWTIQAQNSYFRVRVTNISTTTTTYFRLQTCLCPIVEAIPRSLCSEGNLKVAIQEIENIEGFGVKISPMGELRISEHVKLAGEKFEGSTVDTNFWASTATGTGVLTQANSEATLSTGATANSTLLVNSVRLARYVGSYPNYFRGVIECPSITGTCVRRWGAFDVNDGLFFEYNGTTLSIVSRKGASDTKIDSASFNGSEGATYLIGLSATTYEIYWTNSSAWFYVDNKFIHKLSGTTDPLCNTQSLKIGLNIINSGGNTNNNILKVRTATINRVGSLDCEKIYKNIHGVATTVLKYGAGKLNKIINGGGAGTATIYDNSAGSGIIIASLLLNSNQNYEFDCPFFTGLTVVTTSASCDITAIYE